MTKNIPYAIALKRIEEAEKTGATELNLSGLGLGQLSVFISYVTQDKQVVDDLYSLLKQIDWLDPWRDKEKLLPGQEWKHAIGEALDKADVFIVCLSNNSITKEGFYQTEIRSALAAAMEKPENTIYLIPLRLDDCPVPKNLLSFQWADYFGSSKKETFSKLIQALNVRYEQKIKLKLERLGILTDSSHIDESVNQLTSLPPEISRLINLDSLDLSFNRLSSLPAGIQNLKKLKKLKLDGNMLPIPAEVLENIKEAQAILNYYFSHLQRSINECKVLVIGQGGVGKTSLIQQLVLGKFNPSETKTEGIAISHWEIKNEQTNNTTYPKINLHLWDFGGQEIMHATHQFFLTKRSLYLLVIDSRLTQEENRVEYWLRMIQSFSDESPVLIIGNKIDQHPLDIDPIGLKKKYPNVVGVLQTSAATGTGIEELKSAIAEQVNNLPHTHDLVPEKWFFIKNELERLGRSSNFITYDRYLELCIDNEVVDETSQRNLIGFLHDLGIILHFQDDPRLEVLGILNPQWVTTGVYKILNSYLLFQNKGVLTVSMLDEILNLSEYPRSKRLFIIDMMKKFELCYDMGSDKVFLIPDLLPKEEPSNIQFRGIPTFEYDYPVLPSSVITRFIVRMNQNIYNGMVWRTGVALILGNNIALVKADFEDRKITVAIDGLEHTRRDTLSAIRYQLDEIHSSIKALNPQKMVPIPYAPNSEPLQYDYLLMLEQEGVESHLVKDGNRLVKVDVRQLLRGIESEYQRRERGETVTNIYIGGNISGNIVVGDENRVIQDRFDEIASAKIEPELKETLKMLAEAVVTMNKSLPAERATETAEDLSRLVEEVTKSKPNKKWYSVSLEGLIKVAENLDKLGEPVINLSRKVLSLLMGGS